jgi:hypothetical protein
VHDTRLEDQLRVELRRAGDALPFTVTAAELERRLVARRRQRQGRRVSLIAAAVAVLSVVSIVAVGNGWILKPSVVVGVSPSPSATTPIVLSPVPSAAGSAPTTIPSPSVPVARVPFGRPDDTILISQAGSGAAGELVVTIVHEDMSTEPGPVLSEADLPDGTTVDLGIPPRVSVTGYLLVRLTDETDIPPGAALYDLHDPLADPRLFTDPSIVAFAWSPTGLLAVDFPDKFVISDPADPSATPQVVPLTKGAVLESVRSGGGIAWSADGTGLLADRTVSGTTTHGVIGLDGIFHVDVAPRTFANAGVERPTDLSGAILGPECTSGGTSGECSIISDLPDGNHPTQWYRIGESGLPDQVWAADGKTIWLVIDEQQTGATTRTLQIETGGPKTYTIVATVTRLPASPTGDQSTIVGMTADDSRMVISLGPDQVLLVNRLTGDTATFDGTFAGWGDATGFTYPNPEAP